MVTKQGQDNYNKHFDFEQERVHDLQKSPGHRNAEHPENTFQQPFILRVDNSVPLEDFHSSLFIVIPGYAF